MKSFKKGILALGLTLGIIASVGGAAFAKTIVNAQINGFATRGRSQISRYAAEANTTFGNVGTVTVYSRYLYVNTKTLSANRVVKDDGGNYRKLASVSFTAPQNCRSVNIYSSHTVYAFGLTWNANTDDTY